MWANEKGSGGWDIWKLIELAHSRVSPWEDPIKLGFNPAPSRAPPRTVSSL